MLAKITACTEYRVTDDYDWAKPQHVEITMEFESVQAGQAFASQLPKSIGAKPGRLQTQDGTVKGYLKIRAILTPTKGNDRNEAGIKRYHAAMRKLTALGVGFEWNTAYANSYPTREAFEAVIG